MRASKPLLFVTSLLAAGALLPAPARAEVQAYATAQHYWASIQPSSSSDIGPYRAFADAHLYVPEPSPGTSDAFAYGDLTTGKMGASAASSDSGLASGDVRMSDTIYFNIAGADAQTITPITFHFEISGMLSSGSSPSVSSGYYQNVISQYIDGRYSNQATYASSLESSSAGLHSSVTQGGFESVRPFETGDGFGAFATFNLIGSNPYLEFGARLAASSFLQAAADFGHTASLRIMVPDNVTWTSASGVFLSNVDAVPEMGAWALMISGFGLTGAAMRRRRSAAGGSSVLS